MIIRAATVSDIPDIIVIFDTARRYFVREGIPQWLDGFPNYGDILADVRNGISRVVVENGKIIATAAFLVTNEPTYDEIDGEWLTADRHDGYCAVHRFAVEASLKGRGIAGFIFESAEKEARELGLVSVRADTHELNHSMRRAIAKNGFTYCGVIKLEDGAPRIAFEKLIR